MKFLLYDKQSTEDTHVQLIHYMPDELPQEMLEQGILVDVVPEPEQVEGKGARLMINPVTKELYYEYYDVPLTESQRINILEEENAILWYEIMKMGGVQGV